MRTIARMYDSYNDAVQVVNALEGAGVPHSEISLIANADAQGRTTATGSTTASTSALPIQREPMTPMLERARNVVLWQALYWAGALAYWLVLAHLRSLALDLSWRLAGWWRR